MKTEILFPEVANLCGDLMNVTYLRQSCPEMEVVETGLKDRPAFLDGGVDLVYVGSATERGLQLMVQALTPYKAELERYVDGGGLMLATGNALDALGEYVMIDGKRAFGGLGILPHPRRVSHDEAAQQLPAGGASRIWKLLASRACSATPIPMMSWRTPVPGGQGGPPSRGLCRGAFSGAA